MYKFSLKIDDDEHSLTKENGISFGQIGHLLETLYAAIDPKSTIKCTLEGIRGNCYALDFVTEEKRYEENFLVVHKNIDGIPYNYLEPAQKAYAIALKRVLGSKYYVSVFDSEGTKVVSLKDIAQKEDYDVYYTQKTIYGVVSQLGGPSLDSSKKSILIDGITYRVKIDKEQDHQLKEFYGSDKLRLKVKQRRSVSKNRIIDAELIGFTKVGNGSFLDNLKTAGYIDFDLIKNTNTIEDIVNKIHTINE